MVLHATRAGAEGAGEVASIRPLRPSRFEGQAIFLSLFRSAPTTRFTIGCPPDSGAGSGAGSRARSGRSCRQFSERTKLALSYERRIRHRGVTRTDPPRLTHSGSNGYNVAEIVVIPRLHAAVLVTCNAGDERARAAAKEAADRLVDELGVRRPQRFAIDHHASIDPHASMERSEATRVMRSGARLRELQVTENRTRLFVRQGQGVRRAPRAVTSQSGEPPRKAAQASIEETLTCWKSGVPWGNLQPWAVPCRLLTMMVQEPSRDRAMGRHPSSRRKTMDLVRFFVTRFSGAIGRTRLIKLIYLADLETRKYLGRPLSNLEFALDQHGPFDKRIYAYLDELLKTGEVSQEEYRTPAGPGYAYHAEAPSRTLEFTPAEEAILSYVCRSYGEQPLPILLDDIVYETEPIRRIRGQPFGTPLPMDCMNDVARLRLGGVDLERALRAEEQAREGETISLERLKRELLGSRSNGDRGED